MKAYVIIKQEKSGNYKEFHSVFLNEEEANKRLNFLKEDIYQYWIEEMEIGKEFKG